MHKIQYFIFLHFCVLFDCFYVCRGGSSENQKKQAPFLFEALVKISRNEELLENVRGMAFFGLGTLMKKFSAAFPQKILFIQSLWEALEKVNVDLLCICVTYMSSVF